VNQHATIEEAVFSVGATQSYITRTSGSSEKRTELSSGDGSCNRELKESPEFAGGRIIARKELGYAKKSLCVI
jgi:hypothetical protein